MHHDVVIVGAELSGLYAALLLQRAGADYVVMEAAPERFASVKSAPRRSAPRQFG